jgi:hypothetical protein
MNGSLEEDGLLLSEELVIGIRFLKIGSIMSLCREEYVFSN